MYSDLNIPHGVFRRAISTMLTLGLVESINPAPNGASRFIVHNPPVSDIYKTVNNLYNLPTNPLAQP